jgi:hypothetical protein
MNPYHSRDESKKYHRFSYYIKKYNLEYDELINLCENEGRNTKYKEDKTKKKRPVKYKEQKNLVYPQYPTPDPNGIISETSTHIFYEDKVWTKHRDQYLKFYLQKKGKEKGLYCKIYDPTKTSKFIKYFINT